jgi:hypothetical protein
MTSLRCWRFRLNFSNHRKPSFEFLLPIHSLSCAGWSSKYYHLITTKWIVLLAALVVTAIISPAPMMPQKSYAQGEHSCPGGLPHRCPLVVTVVNAASCDLDRFGCPAGEYIRTTVVAPSVQNTFFAVPCPATSQHPCVWPIKTLGPL